MYTYSLRTVYNCNSYRKLYFYFANVSRILEELGSKLALHFYYKQRHIASAGMTLSLLWIRNALKSV